jgi:hypothetical protein
MKFLTKLGQILVKATAIITGLGPLFPDHTSAIGKVRDTLSAVASIVVNVEAFGQVLGTTGQDKLRAATPMVTQILLQSDLLIGKKIDDPVLFSAGVEKITSGVADVLNSLDDKIDTTSVV